MAKQLKQLIRQEIEKRFQDVDGGVIVTYRGLDSEHIYDLRAKLRAKGARLQVLRNAMAVRAFQTLGYDEKKLAKLFEGPVGVVYSQNGAGVVGAVKALLNWKKETKDKFVEVKGGFLEGSVLDTAGAKALADLPSREQLLATLAGTFQAPITGFAHALYECQAKFAYAINAVKDKKEKEGGGASPQPAK